MSAPLRVTIDGACWWNNRGFGRFTRELVRELARQADRSDLALTLLLEEQPPSADPDHALPDIPTTTVGVSGVGGAVAHGGARSPLHLARMGAAFARTAADVLFFPAVYSWVPVPARTPQVITLHDAIAHTHPDLVFPTRRNRFFWDLKTFAARRQATRILTVSAAAADAIQAELGIPRDRIDVTNEAAAPVFRPVSLDGFALRARLGIPTGGPLLLHVGGFTPHKNLLRLLDAFAVLKAPATLALVGDTSGAGFHDNLEAIRGWLKTHPRVAERVALPGRVNDDDLVGLYSTATALVFPSLAEGFGLPAAEAMACGCPVLGSDRTSLPEVIGEAGLLFDPLVPASITAAMRRVLADSALRAELGRRALARSAELTWARSADHVIASLRRAVG